MATTRRSRIERLADSWTLHLESAGRSPKTIRSYTDTIALLDAWLEAEDLPRSPRDIRPEHLRRWLLAERERTSPSTAQHHYRNARALWSWMRTEEIVRTDAMAKVERPEAPRRVMPGIEDDTLEALYKTCAGKSYENRRDTVILDLLADTGMRVGSLVGLGVDDADLKGKRLLITQKGARQLLVPIGRTTARDLDRYLRVRDDHPQADRCPRLLLGKRGPMTVSGVQQMLRRRAEQAGIPAVSPHRFRRQMAADWLRSGGSETDLMHIGGWESRDMVARYAEHAQAERALEAHARLSPVDRRRAEY
jgi:site-specific recombinase XerD